MITLRRNSERRHLQQEKNDIWLTFRSEDGPGAATGNFGGIIAFDEFLLPPGAVTTSNLLQKTEIVTYMHRGALAQKDSSGRSGVVHAGEFQHMIPGRGVHHREANASLTDPVHFFRLSLRSSESGIEGTQKQRRFAAAQRHNLECVVASPDGRKGSLAIHQDVLVHSAVLDPGHHLIHELEAGRSAWLHIIYGEAVLQDIVLARGDGVGVAIEQSVSFTAQKNTEVLIVDIGVQSGSLIDGVKS